MRFLLADSFTGALARLPTAEAKAVKTTVVDLQIDPTGKGLSFHRIDKSKDPNFWSVRVGRDLRLIVHKTADSLLVAYVDHHDKAYAWAERRRIEAHPSTGAIQIVEVRERVEETPPVVPNAPAIAAAAAQSSFRSPPLVMAPSCQLEFRPTGSTMCAQRLKMDFSNVAAHLPAEAAEALLQYAAAGTLPISPPTSVERDPYAHPDAQRRIRLIVGEEELRQALDYPWERWGVFLHPSQRAIVERRFAGPARVSGSAGTGKTVVALHRAVAIGARKHAVSGAVDHVFRTAGPTAGRQAQGSRARHRRYRSADHRLGLARRRGRAVPADPWPPAADRPHRHTAHDDREGGDSGWREGFTSRFLLSEWTNVVDAWGIDGLERYASVPRLGRRTPLGPRQRERLWSVFEPVAAALCEQGIFTRAEVCRDVAAHYATRESTPFDHIVVDEAQDLGPAELAFLAAIAPSAGDALFFAGDSGQRIFQHSFSWKALGIEVRGRSATSEGVLSYLATDPRCRRSPAARRSARP